MLSLLGATVHDAAEDLRVLAIVCFSSHLTRHFQTSRELATAVKVCQNGTFHDSVFGERLGTCGKETTIGARWRLLIPLRNPVLTH